MNQKISEQKILKVDEPLIKKVIDPKNHPNPTKHDNHIENEIPQSFENGNEKEKNVCKIHCDAENIEINGQLATIIVRVMKLYPELKGEREKLMKDVIMGMIEPCDSIVVKGSLFKKIIEKIMTE